MSEDNTDIQPVINDHVNKELVDGAIDSYEILSDLILRCYEKLRNIEEEKGQSKQQRIMGEMAQDMWKTARELNKQMLRSYQSTLESFLCTGEGICNIPQEIEENIKPKFESLLKTVNAR